MAVTVTFNVIDAITGSHLKSVVFNPADGGPALLVNSPFTHEYDADGEYYPTVDVSGYKGSVINVNTVSSITADVTLSQLFSIADVSSLYQNLYIDEMVYSVNNVLTSCRMRIYKDAESVGTDDNVLFTYQMTATETSGIVATYKTVRV